MRNRHHSEPEESHERWLVSYADFITLLFAFFAVLYATSEQNVEKAKGFQESIQKYLIKTGGGGGAPGAADVNQAQNHNAPIESPLPTYREGRSEGAELQKKIEVGLESMISRSELNSLLRDIQNEGQSLRISLAGDQVFSAQSVLLRKEAVEKLRDLSKLLSSPQHRLAVEVSTASSLDQSTAQTGWGLAAQRSVTIAKFFSRVGGWPSQKLSAGVSSAPTENRLDLIVTVE